MSRVTVRIRTPRNFEKRNINLARELSDRQLRVLAEETEAEMKKQVRDSIQRPGSTGNLENNIFAERITFGWGVGNIDHLNQTAPYWKWINDGVAETGRTTPPATTGQFSPGTPEPDSNSFREGRLEEGPFPINPQNPIEPHNYIEKTQTTMLTKIKQILKRVR